MESPTRSPACRGRAEAGEVIFFDDSFWRVDAIEEATSETADGRLLVSFTTDAPPPHLAT